MKILQEGTINILPDGVVLVQNFCVEGGTLNSLRKLCGRRVKKAADRIRKEENAILHKRHNSR